MTYRVEPDPSSIYFRGFADCNDAIMITDHSGKIIYVNSAWEQLFGFDRSEVIGKTPKILRSGKHDAAFYENIWNSITDPQIAHWKGEVVNRCKSGLLIPVFLMITTIRHPDQSIYGYVGIATDFRAHKESEQKQRQYDNLSAIRMFSEGLAHQIGTTLAVIRGRAELLATQPPSQSAIKIGTQTIIEQVDRIQQCVAYLLQFCRTSQGLDLKEVEVGPLLREVQSHFEQKTQDLDIVFKIQFLKHPPIKADPHRMKQILTHLLDNAIDAIEASQKKLSETKVHTISINAEELDSEIKITIQDTGCGIDEKDLEKIFQPFFTSKDIGKGIGLGLSLALTLTQDMGGRISVASKVGAGSTFSLHFPKA